LDGVLFRIACLPFGVGQERGLETALQKQCMPEIVMAKGHLRRELDDLAEGSL